MTHRPRILIADDLPVNRTLLEYFLNKYGDCQFATTGLEVLSAFDQGHETSQPLDLIMLDIMMPEMDGQEALSVIRKKEQEMGLRQNQEVSVIMVTSLGDWDNALAGFKKGVLEYVVKPIKESKLRKSLNEMGFHAIEQP